MAVKVLSPLSGQVVEFAEVPDPVFSGGFLGPGLAIDPDRESQEAVAPVSGTIGSMMPHAFGISTPDGLEVLVHLGIDTVKLDGKGFTMHHAKGDTVEAGAPIVTWDPSVIEAGGNSPISPVIALQYEPTKCMPLAKGKHVSAGDPLLALR
jgi:PTS system glucose-specific IIA component